MTTVTIPETSFVRDIHSKALLNTNKNELNEYLMKKEIAKKQQENSNLLTNKVDKLESEIFEIKNVLLQIQKSLIKDAN